MSAPPSSPHFVLSPSHSHLLCVGGDAMVRAFSLSSAQHATPLRGWPAMPYSYSFNNPSQQPTRRDGLFLCPGSWEGSQGVEGRVWMASRASGDVYRLTLGFKKEED